MATQYQFGIKLSVDGEQEVVAATDKTSRAFTDMGRVTDGLVGKLGALAAAYVGAQTVQEFVKTADAMALLDGRLRNAVGAGQAFAESQAEIYRIAQANNIGLQEAAALYTKLYEPVKRLGGGTRETAAIVDAFATSMRVGGASAQEASAATLQFAQAMGSGKLQGDEFRSMAEASPRFMKALAEGMGAPIETLKEMATEGKLTADVVGNALIKSLGQLQAEASGLPDTVGGAFTRLTNEATLAAQAFDQTSNSTRTLAEFVGAVASLVGQFTDVLKGTAAQATLAGSSFDTVGLAIRAVGTIAETVIVLMSDVSFVLTGLGREAGAVAAQMGAVLRGDFAAVGRIRDELIADNTRARGELDKYQASVLGMTDKVLQQRDALRNNSLSAGENATEQAKLSRQTATTGSAFTTLKSSVDAAGKAKKEAKTDAEKLIDSYVKLSANITSKVQASTLEAAQDLKLTDAQKAYLPVLEALRDGKAKYADLVNAGVIAQMQGTLAADAEAEAAKRSAAATALATKATAEAAAEQERHTASILKKTTSLDEEIAKQTASNDVLRGNKTAQSENTAEKYRALAASTELAAITALERTENVALYEALKRQAEAYRTLGSLAAEEGPLKLAQETRKEWDATAKSIADGLTDSLFRAAESGKGFFRTLRDGLVSMFKTTILKPTIQAIMAPISGAIGSLFGLTGTASAGTSATGGLGSLGSLAGLAGSVGSFGSGIGAGLSAIIGEAGLAGGVSAGLTAVGAGNVAGGLGTLAGSLGPYALAAVAAYMIANKLFGSKGGPKTEGGFASGSFTAPGGGAANSDAAALFQTLQQQYAGYTSALGGKAGELTGSTFFSKDPKGSALTQLTIEAALNGAAIYSRTNGGNSENVGRTNEEFAAAVAQAQTQALVAALKATTYADPEIARMVNEINAAGDAASISAAIQAIVAYKAEQDAKKPGGADGETDPLGGVASGISPAQYEDGTKSIIEAVKASADKIVAALGENVARLEQTIMTGDTANAAASQSLVKLFERLIPDGDALATRAAA